MYMHVLVTVQISLCTGQISIRRRCALFGVFVSIGNSEVVHVYCIWVK